jgi:hypothetical protein
VTLPDKDAGDSEYSAADLKNKIIGSELASDYVFSNVVVVEGN